MLGLSPGSLRVLNRSKLISALSAMAPSADINLSLAMDRQGNRGIVPIRRSAISGDPELVSFRIVLYRRIVRPRTQTRTRPRDIDVALSIERNAPGPILVISRSKMPAPLDRKACLGPCPRP